MLCRGKCSVDTRCVQALFLKRLGVIVTPSQLFGPPKIKGRSAEVIGSGLGYRVHDTAGRAAELGGVTGCDHLKFADRFLRQGKCEVRTFAAADTAEERLVVIDSVDVNVAVDAALA